MRTPDCDAARSDDEWRLFLSQETFGQVIASGLNRPVPVVAAAHYAFNGVDIVELHRHRESPLWYALGELPLALFDVTVASVYIPTTWKVDSGAPPEWAPPTSYFASVQATCRATVLEDPQEIAAVLRRQLARLQPEGGYASVEAGENPFGRLLRSIRGLRLEISDVRARFKFGNNKTVDERLRVASLLAGRDGPNDRQARAHVLRRLQRDQAGLRAAGEPA